MRCKQWIFDMDGTLTDSMGVVWEHAPLALLEKFGIEPKPDLCRTLLSMGLQDGALYLINEYHLPLDESNYMTAVRDVVRQLYTKVELKPGAREMLAALKANGASMCICSNTWEEQCREVLGRLGVADYFDFFITAQGADSKHHPDVFFKAMKRLGGTDPACCAVCEDAVYSASTAHGAGFYVVGIQDSYSKPDEPEMRRICDRFVANWHELDLNNL